MHYLDFGMKFNSDNGDSVSIVFYTQKKIDLLIYNIHFFSDSDENESNMSSISGAFSVVINVGEKKVPFKYPKTNSPAYDSIEFYVQDNIQMSKYKVILKFDDSLPSIEPIKE